jgi:site-specific DNA recombinase
MLARDRAGEFGTIIAYSNSRLTRRPREYETLIELHK